MRVCATRALMTQRLWMGSNGAQSVAFLQSPENLRICRNLLKILCNVLEKLLKSGQVKILTAGLCLHRSRVRPRCRDYCRLSLRRRPPAQPQPDRRRFHQHTPLSDTSIRASTSSCFCFPQSIPFVTVNR